MTYNHFNWFERAWNSTFGVPEQLVRRMWRVAQGDADFFSEEGFMDASLIPIIGAFDSKRKDVTDSEFIGRINDTFGSDLNQQGFWTTVGTSLLTDPLSYMTGGLSAAAKGAMAGNRLKRIGTMRTAQFDDSVDTVDRLRDVAKEKLRLREGTAEQRKAIRKELRQLDKVDGSMTLQKLRNQETDRRLMLALPFTERFDAAPKIVLSKEHQSWMAMALKGTGKVTNATAAVVGAALLPVSKIPGISHTMDFIRGTHEAWELSGKSLGTRSGVKAGKFENKEVEAVVDKLQDVIEPHQLMGGRSPEKVIERLAQQEKKAAKAAEEAKALREEVVGTTDPKKRKALNARIRRREAVVNKYNKMSKEERMLRAFGVKTRKLTQEQIEMQGGNLWRKITGVNVDESRKAVFPGSSDRVMYDTVEEFADELRTYRAGMDDGLTFVRDSHMTKTLTEAGKAIEEANKRGDLFKLAFNTFEASRKRFRNIFRTDIKTGELKFLEEEAMLRTHVAAMTTAVQERASILWPLMREAAEENNLSVEQFDTMLMAFLETSAHQDEVVNITKLAIDSKDVDGYLKAVQNYIRRAESSFGKLQSLAKEYGMDDFVERLGLVDISTMLDNGVLAKYGDTANIRAIRAARDKAKEAAPYPPAKGAVGAAAEYAEDGIQYAYKTDEDLLKVQRKNKQEREKLERQHAKTVQAFSVPFDDIVAKYEGMSEKMLKNRARQRKIEGYKDMSRSELEEAMIESEFLQRAKKMGVEPDDMRARMLDPEDRAVRLDELAGDIERVMGTPAPIARATAAIIDHLGLDDGRMFFRESGQRMADEVLEQRGRRPELVEAALGLEKGSITAEEYTELVEDLIGPVRPYTREYLENNPPPSTTQMVDALDANKKNKVGKTLDLKEVGDRVGLRLDIPAYTKHNVWVPTVHEAGKKGKVIAHEAAASITDVTFVVPPENALNVAKGASKSPFARIEGKLQSVDSDELYERAKELLDDPEWVQVGMNPERHQFFFDRINQRPVVSADEVVQVGNLVLAKNAKFGESADYLYQGGRTPRKPMDRAAERKAIDQMKTEAWWQQEASKLSLEELREVGKLLGVTGNTKEKLAFRIREAYLPVEVPRNIQSVGDLPKAVRDELTANDNLGFGSQLEAWEAIWSNPDWATRWDVSPKLYKAVADIPGARIVEDVLYQGGRRPQIREVSMDEAVKAVRPFLNRWTGWFREGDKSIKPNMVSALKEQPSVQEGAQAIFYDQWKGFTGKDDVSFQEFLDTPIKVYRSGPVDTDAPFMSYTLDKDMAVKHRDTGIGGGGPQRMEVEEIVVTPRDTYGMFTTTAELEVLVRADYFGRGDALFQEDFIQRNLPFDATSEAAKGAVSFTKDGRAFIQGLTNPDATTALHESGHVLRRRMYESPDGYGFTTKEQSALERWCGVTDGNWTRDAEEIFARGWERYLRGGSFPKEAPKEVRSALRKVYEAFKAVYRSIVGSPVEAQIPKDVRDIFNRLMKEGGPKTRTQARDALAARRRELQVGSDKVSDRMAVLDQHDEWVQGLLESRKRGESTVVEPPKQIQDPRPLEGQIPQPVGRRTPEQVGRVDEDGELVPQATANKQALSELQVVITEARRVMRQGEQVDERVLREISGAIETVSRTIEDTMRAGLGAKGNQALSFLRNTQAEVLRAAAKSGVLSAASPLAYVGRFLDNSQKKVLAKLLGEIPRDLKQSILPEFASSFGRDADHMSVFELNDLAKAARDASPDSAWTKEFNDFAKSIDPEFGTKYSTSAGQNILASFAAAQTRTSTAEFIDAMLAKGEISDGVRAAVGGRVVAVVDVADTPTEVKALRVRTSTDKDLLSDDVEIRLESIEKDSSFRGLVIENEDGTQQLLDLRQLRDSEISLSPLGKRGETTGQAFALAATDATRGRIKKDFLLSRHETSDLNTLLGERVLYGDQGLIGEMFASVSRQYEAMGPLLSVYDSAHNVVKSLQTVVRPDFHLVNMSSSMFQMLMTDGVRTSHVFGGLLDALKLLMFGKQDVTDILDIGSDMLDSSMGLKFSSRIRRRGILGEASKYDEMDDIPVFRFGNQEITYDELFDAMAKNGVLQTFVSEGLRGGSTITETMVRLREEALSLMDEVGGFKKALQLAKKGNKKFQAVAEFSELAMRVTSVQAHMRAGYSLETAVKKTKEALVDYADLTEFEKKYFKRAFSYYTFPRKFLPYAFKRFDEDPSKLGVISSFLGAGFNTDVLDTTSGRLDLNLTPTTKLNIGRFAGNVEAAIMLPRLLAAAGAYAPGVLPGEQQEAETLKEIGVPSLRESAQLFEGGAIAKLVANGLFGESRDQGKGIMAITPISRWIQTRIMSGAAAQGIWSGNPNIERSFAEDVLYNIMPYREVEENHTQETLRSRYNYVRRLARKKMLDAAELNDQAEVARWQKVVQETTEELAGMITQTQGSLFQP